MTEAARGVSVGRVGRAHGYDGSFYVEQSEYPLSVGDLVTVAGRERRIERRGGTDSRPLVRLGGVDERQAAIALQGERLLMPETAVPLDEGEWLAEDLIGLRVEGIGRVTRVLDGASCSVLELEGGTLVPFIADAVVAIDAKRGLIDVDREFLRLEGGT